MIEGVLLFLLSRMIYKLKTELADAHKLNSKFIKQTKNQ